MEIPQRQPSEDWLRERFLTAFAELAKATDGAKI